MLSWDYPRNDNLHDRIQRAGIYPVTVLQNLSSAQAEMLIARDIILCKDILADVSVLKQLHLPKAKYEELLEEIRALCGPDKHSK
jgi:hypothetical protein